MMWEIHPALALVLVFTGVAGPVIGVAIGWFLKEGADRR